MKMRRRKAEYRRKTLLIRSKPLLLGVLFAACSEDPTLLNSLDTRFTDVDVVIIADTLKATSSSSFLLHLPMNGTVNLVGTSGQHDALMALQFTALPQRDTVEVLSAQLKLRAVTWFGDSLQTLGFSVHKVLRSWSSLTLTRDSLEAPGFYEDGIIRGMYSGQITADTEDVVVDLDTSMVRDWLRPLVAGTQYGLALIPTTAMGVIRGFTAFGADSAQFNPTLTVIARNLAGTVQDTSEYSVGNDTFAGDITNLASNTSRMYVQAGVVYRSRLMFDASSIPVGAIINKADLVLQRDDTLSIMPKFAADSLVAAHVLVSSTDSSAFELAGSLARTDDSGNLLFDVRHAVQLWVNGTNNGMLLRSSSLNEFSSLDLQVFYGPAEMDSAVRPVVNLLYSIESKR